jgi:cytochrome b pre-mRNA-processing protein 3
MILPLFRRGTRHDTISTLYGTIVAQARLPCLYQDYRVADTVNGRFDLIVLHLALVLERFATEPSLARLAQGLFDRFWVDMDHNLREMGVGDLAVPKRMRALGEAYYGRTRVYREALAAGDEVALTEALARNIFAGAPDDADAPRRLAAYIETAHRALAAQTAEQLAAGAVAFPDPIECFKSIS